MTGETKMKVSIIGLGKLGLPMAAFFASKGHRVTGLDVSESLIRRLRNGECPIEETDLEPLLSQQHIVFTTNFTDVLRSEIVFIIVPTPSLPNGRFSNEYVLNALFCLSDYKGLVVITSTVMPGSCEKEFKPLLPNAQLCYGPEFIALGSVLHNMAHPDSVLIGEDCKESGDKLEVFHRTLYDVPICRMSLWNAEVAKLALNVSVTMKIGLANMLTDVCERIPRGDVNKVTNFIGHDSRIGHKYFGGGLSFGGPCFPRDGRAFMCVAKELELDCPTVKANDDFNQLHNENVVKRALTLLGGDTVSVLGLTYKVNTNVIEESAAIGIAGELSKYARVRVYDPLGMENAKKILENKAEYCASVLECLGGSDLAIIATPWDEFKDLTPGVFIDLMRRPVVFDCWRILRDIEGLEYHALGVND